MTFAILLLGLLVVACAVGSFVTQGQTYEWYAATYSETAAAWIVALHLDDAFHSWWFIAITAFLCANLLLCNVLRLGSLIRRTKAANDAASYLGTEPDASASGISDPEGVFHRLRMPKPKRVEANGKTILFSAKNRAGLWGAWVCHLGILLLILGFGLGQMTKKEFTVYGVPGQEKPIADTGLTLRIDDFRVALREDETVEQYTADITVFRMPQGSTSVPDQQSATISVNHPGRLLGMTFYQNATGWAAQVDVWKAEQPLQSEILCAGEYLTVRDLPELVVFFNAFYPDYALVPGEGPKTLSSSLKNPAYLYSVYYRGEMIGMNVLMAGEKLTIDDYTVTFSAPQNYTLIQIKRDSFTWLAFVGGIVTMLGLLLAFYLFPQAVWAEQADDGTWTVHDHCRKRGTLYRETFLQAASKNEKE